MPSQHPKPINAAIARIRELDAQTTNLERRIATKQAERARLVADIEAYSVDHPELFVNGAKSYTVAGGKYRAGYRKSVVKLIPAEGNTLYPAMREFDHLSKLTTPQLKAIKYEAEHDDVFYVEKARAHTKTPQPAAE